MSVVDTSTVAKQPTTNNICHITNMLLPLHTTMEQKLFYEIFVYTNTGRERLIRSHSSARFSFELSGNSN